MYEYYVVSKWTGIFGGWGSESDIAAELNRAASDGWRLVRTENIRAIWLWFLPRPKLLMIFERAATPAT